VSTSSPVDATDIQSNMGGISVTEATCRGGNIAPSPEPRTFAWLMTINATSRSCGGNHSLAILTNDEDKAIDRR
jgi:hypothetical protein